MQAVESIVGGVKFTFPMMSCSVLVVVWRYECQFTLQWRFINLPYEIPVKWYWCHDISRNVRFMHIFETAILICVCA